MKKLITCAVLIGCIGTAKAQTTFLGAPTTTYGAIYRSGNISVGTSNNVGYPADNTGSFNKLGVYTTDGSGLGIIETGGNNASLTLRSALSPSNYAWILNTFSNGNFNLIKENNTNPALFISGSTGRISLGGNTSPNCSLHIGDGSGSLHYGTTGVLMKYASGDRTLLEIHDPTDQAKLAIQSLSWGSYITGLNTAPLFLQTAGGNLIVGGDAQLSGARMEVKAPSTVINAFDITNSTTGNQVFRVKTNGITYAQEIIVQLPAFPDYVFNKNYSLMPLDKLESYINSNHHLPNVPSAEEVAKDGGNLGELSKIQMEKIEELTLYVIELKKEIEELKKENAKK